MTKFLEWSRRLQFNVNTDFGAEVLTSDPITENSFIGTEITVTSP